MELNTPRFVGKECSGDEDDTGMGNGLIWLAELYNIIFAVGMCWRVFVAIIERL